MPVEFYYNQKELAQYYGEYTKGNDWNAKAGLTDEPNDGPNAYTQKEEGILNTFKNSYHQGKKLSFVKTSTPEDKLLAQLILDIANGSEDQKNKYTVYVLKGIHTKPELHFTVGFAGQLFHMNVKRLGADNSKFMIHSMSGGDKLKPDPEWKVK
jgi:hypothetical protein